MTRQDGIVQRQYLTSSIRTFIDVNASSARLKRLTDVTRGKKVMARASVAAPQIGRQR